MNCPRCGARLIAPETEELYAQFECLTFAGADAVVNESDACLRRQRDAIAAGLNGAQLAWECAENRVKRLESDNDALAARVKRLEEAGDALVKCLPEGRYGSILYPLQVGNWNAAKEAK